MIYDEDDAEFTPTGEFIVWMDPDREDTYLKSELLVPNEVALALDGVKATNAISTRRMGTFYVYIDQKGSRISVSPSGEKGLRVKMTFLHNREEVDAWILER